MTTGTAARNRANAFETSPVERILAQGGIVIALVVIAVVGTALMEPRFLNRLNITNLLRNVSFLALPSLAQMLVMTTGGFDLSVGAVLAVSSVVTAMIMLVAGPMFPGMDLLVILMALGGAVSVGVAVGLVNGLLIARFGLSPFMVTLAVTSGLMGLALYYTQGIPIYGVLDSFSNGIGRGQVLGLPMVLAIALVVLAAIILLQRRTVLGRHIYAVGSDARSARLSGVPVRRTLVVTYVMASVLAAFAGFLMTSRLGSGQATIGGTLALESIAAAVIGGVSLRGGVGRAEHVFMAALFLTVIANAMNLLQIDSKYQTLMLGAVLIGALSLERLLLRKP
ncbi:ABC transporter permease [Ensifer soli]|uniref:ABC transporter permease n=1 Tax=Ciceribacter sp. sgz301302 TaxID=3342379 RepID=UPI0035B80D38